MFPLMFVLIGFESTQHNITSWKKSLLVVNILTSASTRMVTIKVCYHFITVHPLVSFTCFQNKCLFPNIFTTVGAGVTNPPVQSGQTWELLKVALKPTMQGRQSVIQIYDAAAKTHNKWSQNRVSLLILQHHNVTSKRKRGGFLSYYISHINAWQRTVCLIGSRE